MKPILNWILATTVWLVSLPRKLLQFWPWHNRGTWHFVRVEDIPDQLAKRKVYLAGVDGNIWAAAMTCPCGCGDAIELNLLSQARPCWSVAEHEDGTLSLMPSVWRQKGCRSHFFMRRGQIDWC